MFVRLRTVLPSNGPVTLPTLIVDRAVTTPTSLDNEVQPYEGETS
jgi:hypothetical protein